MKYGDIVEIPRWYRWKSKNWLYGYRKINFNYRFRVDPVPFIHKRPRRMFGCYYKTPRHINEKKQFYACDDKSLVRGKRTPINLPQPYDDVPRGDSFNKKSWKKSFKVRKQWAKHIGRKPGYKSEYPDMFSL